MLGRSSLLGEGGPAGAAADASALLVLGASSNDAQSNALLVVCFLSLFLGLHAFSIAVSARLAPQLYIPLSPSDQRDWHGRVVGSAFATGIVLLALPEYLGPGGSLAADETFGTSDRANLACCVSAAFFCWDVAYCVLARQGWPFVLHAAIRVGGQRRKGSRAALPPTARSCTLPRVSCASAPPDVC